MSENWFRSMFYVGVIFLSKIYCTYKARRITILLDFTKGLKSDHNNLITWIQYFLPYNFPLITSNETFLNPYSKCCHNQWTEIFLRLLTVSCFFWMGNRVSYLSHILSVNNLVNLRYFKKILWISKYDVSDHPSVKLQFLV